LKRIFSTLLCFLTTSCFLFAQDKPVQGIVFDKDTKQRITRVYIYNLRTNKGVFNNFRGEFNMNCRKGDTLLAALEGYAADTVTIKSDKAVVFYLRRTSIRLKEVTVTDTIRRPDRQLQATKREYRDIYRKGNDKDIFSIGRGGAGLSIDAIYSLLSREGKNARYLQQIIERDYRESIIDYRYSKALVSKITGLENTDLEDFMQQYRPSYYFILQANDYLLIKFIKDSYQKYLKNPGAFRLQPLKPGNK